VTAAYVGTGIYESTVEWATLRPTTITVEPDSNVVAAGSRVRFNIRVTAADGSTPEGTITLVTAPGHVEMRPRNGRAFADVILRRAGENAVWANFYSHGVWQSSSSSLITVKVTTVTRRRTVRR
jgi:hypothetical protein